MPGRMINQEIQFTLHGSLLMQLVMIMLSVKQIYPDVYVYNTFPLSSRQGRKHSDPSQGHTIEGLLVPFWSMISPGGKPLTTSHSG